jgi:hypothetical protein
MAHSSRAPRSAARELTDALRQTWQLVEDCLQPLVSANLGVEFSRERSSRRRFTRAWVIWHMLEHDLHHGSEIALILPANCLPTIHL